MVCIAHPPKRRAQALLTQAAIEHHRAEMRWHSGMAAFFGVLASFAMIAEAYWSFWIWGPFVLWNLWDVRGHRRAVKRLESELIEGG